MVNGGRRGMEAPLWRRWLLASLLGLVMALAGCSSSGGPAPAVSVTGTPNPSLSAVQAEITHDEGAVADLYHGCKALRLSPPHCPFKAASTPNSSGGTLIAVDITQQTGDDCYRGKVFFFNGETPLASTSQLPPHSKGGVEAVSAAGQDTFAVTFGTSPSASTSCAQNGSAGPDIYRYAFNGAAMTLKSGTPPAAPKVIVGA